MIWVTLFVAFMLINGVFMAFSLSLQWLQSWVLVHKMPLASLLAGASPELDHFLNFFLCQG
ncbi:hypothetical protein AYI98_11995 [Shewanella algae]|nr:hypothetical protein AYI98_11995 [Shewanella algae]